jgi:hypothetical protein
LIAELVPDDLSRKTYRAILTEINGDDDGDKGVRIGEDSYHTILMEGAYDHSSQISAREGSIVLWNPVTYGYGTTIEWSTLQAQKDRLEAWCQDICPRHHCGYKIVVSANYW